METNHTIQQQFEKGVTKSYIHNLTKIMVSHIDTHKTQDGKLTKELT